MDSVIATVISTFVSSITGLIIGVLVTRINNYRKIKNCQDEDLVLIENK